MPVRGRTQKYHSGGIEVANRNRHLAGHQNNSALQTLTFHLAGLAIVVLACGPSSSVREEVSSQAEPIHHTTGEFITPEEAALKLADYKAWRKAQDPAYDPKADVYGFVFGLDRMKELLERVEEINLHYPDSIVAIRVYQARKSVPGTKYGISDVFLVPVDSRGKNIFPIDPDFDGITSPRLKSPAGDGLILNKASPCPFDC